LTNPAKEIMKSPCCPNTTVVMTDRQGVEIDYCSACCSIWLDRGELDKRLDRAAECHEGRLTGVELGNR